MILDEWVRWCKYGEMCGGGKKVWGKKEGERKKKEGRNKKEGWRVNGGRGIVGRYVTCSHSGQDDGVYMDEALH